MVVTLLENHHYRRDFECEEEPLTAYIRQQVSQDIRKRFAACFVAVNEAQHVMGYYTLASESLGRDLIPAQYIKTLPKNYNAPVILLGRLARDLQAKGTGLGEHLLLDALFRSYTLSKESIGTMAVVVDPINEYAVAFYTKFGFEQLPDSEKLFLPMNVMDRLF